MMVLKWPKDSFCHFKMAKLYKNLPEVVKQQLVSKWQVTFSIPALAFHTIQLAVHMSFQMVSFNTKDSNVQEDLFKSDVLVLQNRILMHSSVHTQRKSLKDSCLLSVTRKKNGAYFSSPVFLECLF